ncbi:hypothetical protein BDW22DRAFT_1044851 [Trametopsis cervina]|nr:hypothetical protein BDW22DRAFT_1044851 [Trametopsis cervina]
MSFVIRLPMPTHCRPLHRTVFLPLLSSHFAAISAEVQGTVALHPRHSFCNISHAHLQHMYTFWYYRTSLK